MAGNRVDELEETVQSLEATVSGLTDELVETKERLRLLEDAVDADLEPDIIEGQVTRSETPAAATPEATDPNHDANPNPNHDANPNPNHDANPNPNHDPGTETGESATDHGEDAADGTKAGGDEESDDADSEGSDDIIVA